MISEFHVDACMREGKEESGVVAAIERRSIQWRMLPGAETSGSFWESFKQKFSFSLCRHVLGSSRFPRFSLTPHMSWSCRGELYLKTENVGTVVSDVKLERYLKALGLLEPDAGFVVSVAKESTQKHRAIIERSVFSCCS